MNTSPCAALAVRGCVVCSRRGPRRVSAGHRRALPRAREPGTPRARLRAAARRLRPSPPSTTWRASWPLRKTGCFGGPLVFAGPQHDGRIGTCGIVARGLTHPVARRRQCINPGIVGRVWRAGGLLPLDSARARPPRWFAHRSTPSRRRAPSWRRVLVVTLTLIGAFNLATVGPQFGLAARRKERREHRTTTTPAHCEGNRSASK